MAKEKHTWRIAGLPKWLRDEIEAGNVFVELSVKESKGRGRGKHLWEIHDGDDIEFEDGKFDVKKPGDIR